MGTSSPLAGGYGRKRGIRASDADRDRSAAALSAHYTAGRLTLEEFQERLDQAYAAKTLGDLDDLMTDLPGPGPSQLGGQRDGNVPPPERRAPTTVQIPVGRYHAAWQFWLGIAIGTFVIWLISGALEGLVLGAFFGWAIVDSMGSLGVTQLAFPVPQLLIMAVVAALAGLLAAIAPSRRAAKLNILQAVTTE
jgi:hypothetical protein